MLVLSAVLGVIMFAGCSTLNNRGVPAEVLIDDSVVDSLVVPPVGKVESLPLVQGSDMVSDVVITPSITVDVEKYRVEIISESIGLREIIDVFLSSAGLSYTAESDLPSLAVSVSGDFTASELVLMLRAVCGSVGCSLRSGDNVYTVQKESESLADKSFVVYRCKYVNPVAVVGDALKAVKNITVFTVGQNIVVIGSSLDVLNFSKFFGELDVDLFEGYYVSCVRVNDADFSVEKLNNMLGFLGVNMASLSVVKVSSGVFWVVSRVREYVETVKKLSGLLEKYSTDFTGYRFYVMRNRSASGAVSFLKSVRGEVSAVADDAVNIVYLKGADADCREFQFLLSLYDKESKQVFVRLFLIDVRSTDSLDVGSDWFVDAGRYAIDKSTFIAPLSGGLNQSLRVGNVTAYFSMLQKKLDAKVVSRPSLYLVSGQESKVDFGQSVPFVSSKNTTNVSNGVVQNVEYRDVGIIFKLKADVLEGGQIAFDVYIENSEMSKKAGVEDNPIFQKDSVSSRFVMSDRSVCVIGGIKKNNSEGVIKGLPFLSRIPVIGLLFGALSKSNDKRELVVCVCPTVVGSLEMRGFGEKVLKGLNYSDN